MNTIPSELKSRIVPARVIVEKMIAKAQKEYYDLSNKHQFSAGDLPRLRELRQMITAYKNIGGVR